MHKHSNPLARKVIARIKGGLGNQLFCYAAARRLALVNDAELVIDDVSGFAYDRTYRRKFSLDRFNIPCRRATSDERMEPFARVRRAILKRYSRHIEFGSRQYIEEEGREFDSRLLHRHVKGTIFLDGYWQSENYFSDISDVIRKDLRVVPPADGQNLDLASSIARKNSVALHVRWFEHPDSTSKYNASRDYYLRAIEEIERKTVAPHYFLFSDNAEAARDKLALQSSCVTLVSHNAGDDQAYADLWLMTQCKHFIIANSTFSWWAAWLGGVAQEIVICPAVEISGNGVTAWNFTGQIPNRWLQI